MRNKVAIISILLLFVTTTIFSLYNNKPSEIVKTQDNLEIETIQELPKEYSFENIDLNNYDNSVKEIAIENDAVGLSVAVFYKGNIIHTYNYGYQDKANQIETSDNTKYRVASVSKTISTMALMKFYDEGYFNLDDSISEITGIDYDSEYGKVTFKDLLTHTSGIYDSSTYKKACNGRLYTTSEVLNKSHGDYEVGSKHVYSNLGIGTVGSIIETFTNEYFSNYMRNYFLDLGIDASYASDLISDQDSMAILYQGSNSYNPKTWLKMTSFYEQFGIGNSYLQADGELMISASDLALLASVLAGDGTLNGKRVLSQEAIDLMLQDYVDVYWDEDQFNGAYRYSEGLACHDFKGLIEGKNIHGHTGYALGAVTAMYFDPDEETGVIILSNGASQIKDDKGNVELTYNILKETYKIFFS